MVLPPVAFGKVPALGDFVSTPGYGDTCRHFEGFVERSLAWASERDGVAWSSAFDQGGIVAFVYQPPQATGDASLLVGVMAPSRDAAGRRYPLAVAVRAPLTPFAQSPQLLPLVFADFFDGASRLLPIVLRAASAGELEACVSRVESVNLGSVPEALMLYKAWSNTTKLGQVWSALFSPERAPTLARVALQMVLASAGPLRGQERPAVKLGLRLPLGEAAAAAVAFWVDLVRQAARWRQTVPNVFWCPDDSIVIQLGDETPMTLLSDCWGEGGESEQLFSLAQAHSSRSLPVLSPTLEALLADETTTVGALLASVAL
jgi:type VI secretion system ImpM family protein